MAEMPKPRWIPERPSMKQIMDRICEVGLRKPTPEELGEAVDAYLHYCETTPLIYKKYIPFKGISYPSTEERFHTPTIHGFTEWCHISRTTFYRWMQGEDVATSNACKRAQDKIFKVALVAGMNDAINTTLLSRYLGLADKTETETTDKTPPAAPAVDPTTVAHLTHPDMTTDQHEAILATGLNVPLFSQMQIDSGMQFYMPTGVDD